MVRDLVLAPGVYLNSLYLERNYYKNLSAITIEPLTGKRVQSYQYYYNATMLGRIENRPEVVSNAVDLTAMISYGIVSVDEPNFVLNVGINQIQEPVVERMSFLHLLVVLSASITPYTYFIGPFLGLGFFFSASFFYTRTLGEKKAKLISVLRQSGLYESSHFLALLTTWAAISFVATFLTLAVGLIAKNVILLNTNFSIQYLILWTTSICIGVIFLLVSALISNRNVGIFVLFLIAIWAMTPSGVISGLQQYNSGILNAGAGSMFTWTNPWCHLSALYVGICSWIESNPGQSYTWKEWDSTATLIYVVDLGAAFGYLVLTCWASSVRDAGEGIFFFLNPYYWGIWQKQRSELLNDTIGRKQRESFERGSISLHKLSKSFDSVQAVKELSMEFLEGETTVLLGHNGAGKTTLVNMIAGKYAPTHGFAFMKGFDLSVDMKKIQNLIGICPQENILWDELTAKHHLELYASFRGIPEEDRDLIISTKLKDLNFGYIYSVTTPVGNFSGGMKRTLQLALASIGEPAVLLLDEPTTGMDPIKMRFTWKVVNQLKKNSIVVLTTHNMEEADALGDKIGIMTDGKLKAFGDPMFLKHRFGGTSISIMYDITHADALEKAIIELVPGSKLTFAGNSLHVDLPRHYALEKSRFLDVIRFLEQCELITEWGMNNGTLEQVFLKLVEFNKVINAVEESLEQKCMMCNKRDACDTQLYTKNVVPVDVNKIYVCRECGEGESEDILNAKKVLMGEKVISKESLQSVVIGKESINTSIQNETISDVKEEQDPIIERARKAIRASEVPAVLSLKSQLKGVFLKDMYIEMSYAKLNIFYVLNFAISVAILILNQYLYMYDSELGWDNKLETCGNGWYLLSYSWEYDNFQLPCSDYIKAYENAWTNSTALLSNTVLCKQYFTFNNTQYCNLTTQETYPNYKYPQTSKVTTWVQLFNETNIWFSNSLVPGDDLLEDPDSEFIFSDEYFAEVTDKSLETEHFSLDELIANNMEKHLATGTPIPQDSPCSYDYSMYIDLKVHNFIDMQSAYNYFHSNFPDYGFSINRLSGNSGILDFNISTYHWEYGAKPATVTTFETYPGYSPWWYECLALQIDGEPEYRITNAAYSQIVTQMTNSYISLAQNKYGKTFSYDKIEANFIPAQEFDYLWIDPSYMFVVLTLLVTMLRMPNHIARIISEREKRLLHLLKCNGLAVSSYFLAEYMYMVGTDLLFYVLYLIFLLISRVDPVKRNGGWVFLLFIMWSHCQAGLCILLASFFTRSQSSTIFAFFVVVLNSIFGPMYYATTEEFMNPAVYLVPFTALDDSLMMISSNRLKPLGLPLTFLLMTGFLYFAIGAVLNLFQEYSLTQLFWLCYGYAFAVEEIQPEKMGLLENQPENPDVEKERKKVSESKVGEFGIRIIDATKIFPATPQNKIACQDFTLGVPSGEVLGLLGPNGAGKSTLLNLLSGLYDPTAGTCEISGHDIVKSRAEAFGNLGVCPQEDLLWEELSVEQHFTMFANIRGVDEPYIQPLVYAIAEMVELDGDAFNMPAANLSGGQQKRLSIGISLMGNPSVWLLDEPSTGLDPGTRKTIWDIVLGQKAMGRCIILTTHSMEEADALSDRICIMARGKMRTIGTRGYLKKSYGQGNVINLRVFPGFELEPYVEFLSSEFKEQVKVGFFLGHKGQLVVPSSVCASLIHEVVEQNKSKFHVKEWSFSHASIVLVLIFRFDRCFYSNS